MMNLDGIPSHILEKALEILGPNGERWVKSSWRQLYAFGADGQRLNVIQDKIQYEKAIAKGLTVNTCHCGEGAIAAAHRPQLADASNFAPGNFQPEGAVEKKAVAFLVSVLPDRYKSVPTYNDSSVGWENFKKTMLKAIETAKEKEAAENLQHIAA